MLSIGLSAFLHYSWNCNYRTTSNHLLTLSLSNVQYYRKLIFVTDEQKQNFSFFDPIFQLLQLCNSSADWAKDLFKASTDSSWDWNYFFFWVFREWRHNEGMFSQLFDQFHQTLGTNPMSHFLAQALFGNYTVFHIFRALEWLSSIPGAKIMGENKNW